MILYEAISGGCHSDLYSCIVQEQVESFESDVAQNRVVKAQNDPVALKDIEENRASQLAKSSSEAIVSTMKGCVQMFSDVFDGLLH